MNVLSFTRHFSSKFRKLTKRNIKLKEKVDETLEVMSFNPFSPVLQTHHVNASIDGQQHYSSRVTGDIRIIWDYQIDKIQILELLDLGGHTGQNKVYK